VRSITGHDLREEEGTCGDLLRVRGLRGLGAESIGGEDYSAEFAALSPEGAPGFPSATNIEYCPVCQGRRGPCICSRAD